MAPERHLKAVPDPDRPDQPPLPINPPKPAPGRRVCAWCGITATTTIMVSPPVFTGSKGRRTIKTPATWADSCREHRRMAYHPLAGKVDEATERRRLRLAAKDQLTITDALEPDDPA